MKILVTGGNGFIAKSIIEKFSKFKKYKVISVCRNDFDLLNSTIVLDYFKKNKFDYVIHTATYDAAPKCSIKDPLKVLENNLKMFFNVLRCEDYFGKMIYFGSGAEFGREHWHPRMKEKHFNNNIPSDQYGFSKYLMTKFTEKSHNILNLRIFSVFGKYDDWRYRFIPNICANAVFDKPIIINQNAVLDYLYIDDLVSIIDWFIIHNNKHNVYNICSGKVYSRVYIAKTLIEISRKNLNLIVKDSNIKNEYSGDNSLLLSELKNFQFTKINEGIKDLFEYYQKHRNLINSDDLMKYV